MPIGYLPAVHRLARDHDLPLGPAIMAYGGADDSLNPEASARLMQEFTPQPKTVIRLEGGHIRGGKTELAKTIVAISQGWLLERGAINPR